MPTIGTQRFCFIIFLLCNSIPHCGQTILDPCFDSTDQRGRFAGSQYLKNVCQCYENVLGADLIKWNGTSWEDTLVTSLVDRPPPDPNCHTKAMWICEWGGGEGVAFKLDKPFEEGKAYTYTFTYANDGIGDRGSFAPDLLTNWQPNAKLPAQTVGTFPAATNGWRQGSVTFTANKEQVNDTWLIILARTQSGIILPACFPENPLQITSRILNDTLKCERDTIDLHLPIGPDYSYVWSTGETTPSISVIDPGTYVASLYYLNCFVKDSITVNIKDCDTWIEMPNFFSPNGDDFNPKFTVKDSNRVSDAFLSVYNRWGEEIYRGDAFSGWDGGNYPSGVYLYHVVFTDWFEKKHTQKGIVTLMK